MARPLFNPTETASPDAVLGDVLHISKRRERIPLDTLVAWRRPRWDRVELTAYSIDFVCPEDRAAFSFTRFVLLSPPEWKIYGQWVFPHLKAWKNKKSRWMLIDVVSGAFLWRFATLKDVADADGTFTANAVRMWPFYRVLIAARVAAALQLNKLPEPEGGYPPDFIGLLTVAKMHGVTAEDKSADVIARFNPQPTTLHSTAVTVATPLKMKGLTWPIAMMNP
jgi:hypothetical protein